MYKTSSSPLWLNIVTISNYYHVNSFQDVKLIFLMISSLNIEVLYSIMFQKKKMFLFKSEKAALGHHPFIKQERRLALEYSNSVKSRVD